MADMKELDNIDEKSQLNAESDSAGMEFQSSKNGEAKIEMPDTGSVGYQCGLTKEELMKYANDPFWIAMRRILFVLFWLLWVGMLAGAVAIIIMTPPCAAPKEPEWYESSPMYELRVDEFSDGDGDGKSNLKGINEKLPYLDDISVSALVLDGLFIPGDEKSIEPARGTLADFEALAGQIKVLLKIPLSKIALNQVDFNEVLRFWLGKGAAGFVFDEIELLNNADELPAMTATWGETIRNFSTEEFPRVSILSSYDALAEEDFCKNAHMILDYKLTELTKDFTPKELLDALDHTVGNRTVSCRANLVLSNGDIQPLLNRVGPAERDRLVMFALLADATPFFYFGEEYANDDNTLPAKLTRNHGKPPKPMNWKGIEDWKKSPDNSFFRVFTRTAKLRKTEYAIRMGDTELKNVVANVVAMSRVKKGNPGFVVVTNFGDLTETVDLSHFQHLPETGHVYIMSTNSEKAANEKVYLNALDVSPHETIVVQFAPIFN